MDEIDRLVDLTKQLRKECPWDREQTHESLKQHLIEESYEVVDALDGGNPDHIREELGDLLLQVLFHANIGEESGTFTLGEIAEALRKKLIDRHPHIFAATLVSGADEVKSNWEKLKMREGRTSLLDGLPRHLPALLHASRIQEKASAGGFDWKQPEDVVEKVAEELAELAEAVQAGDADATREEFGDLLFSLVNYARFLKIDPEASLRRTIEKFRDRFTYIESELKKKGKTPADSTLTEMDNLWNDAKNR